MNMVNGGSSNWRKLVMPKKIHFNWKTNVSEINNWVFLGSSREIAVLGISSPICGSHPGHETLSFAQFLKSQSTQQKKKRVEDATLVYIKNLDTNHISKRRT